MTNYERAVLEACDRRFSAMLEEDGYLSDAAALEAVRDKQSPAAELVRVVAQWRAATGRAHQP